MYIYIYILFNLSYLKQMYVFINKRHKRKRQEKPTVVSMPLSKFVMFTCVCLHTLCFIVFFPLKKGTGF